MVGSKGLGEPLGICQKSEKAFGSVPPAIRISASVFSLYSDNLSLQTDPDDRNMIPDCQRMFWNSIPVQMKGVSAQGTYLSAEAIIVGLEMEE